jgi:C1A family cysteine protease
MQYTVAATVIAATLASTEALSTEGSNFLLQERFESFKKEHNKVYESEEEHAKRFAIFEDNVNEIAKKNAVNNVHGITRFADLTQDEFKFYLGVDASMVKIDPNIPVLKSDNVTVGASGSFNWSDEGKLTAVKDQAQCGSCWAFSATETIETAWAMAGNKLTEFSPQNLVSCDKVDAGCNGGLPSNAFEFVKSQGGMCTESDYPYTSQTGNTGTCKSPLPPLSGGTISSWGYGQSPCQGFSACTEDTDGLIANLKKYGPMSIAIDASQWNSYTGGVMTSASCSNSPRRMDHAVQLVGYNADATEPYWIVRNSWTTQWGESGFIKLKMGENTCGIANLAAQVTAV